MALCVHDGFWHPQAPLYRVSDILFETAHEVGSQLKAYESDVRFAEDGEEVLLADYVSEQFAALISASEQYMGMIGSISPQSCAYLLCTKDIRREIGLIRPSSKTSKKQCLYATFIDGTTAERFGYLKNDVLFVDVVKTNQEAFKRAGMAQPDVRGLLELT